MCGAWGRFRVCACFFDLFYSASYDGAMQACFAILFVMVLLVFSKGCASSLMTSTSGGTAAGPTTPAGPHIDRSRHELADMMLAPMIMSTMCTVTPVVPGSMTIAASVGITRPVHCSWLLTANSI